MPTQTPFFHKLSTKIAGISLIVTLFFVVVVFGILLPAMERELTASRRDSLQALVESVYSLISEYELRVQTGELSLDEAKQRFLLRLKNMRFKNHDYFWVQNNFLPYPTLIMHPADPSLNGTVVKDQRFEKAFALRHGVHGREEFFPRGDKNLLQAAAEVALESGHGFISYDWPKPTATGLTEEYYPKQSYVRHFKPWGWIIGTGLYFNDIQAEMSRLRWSIILSVAVMLGLATTMTLLALRSITRPFNSLLRYSDEVSHGNLDAQVTGKITGEFLQLKQSTESMVRALRTSLQEARDKADEAYQETKRSKQAEQALRQSEERLQLVTEATLDGIWDLDMCTEEAYFSPGYTKMLGYDPRDFVNGLATLQSLIHPEDQETMDASLMECIQGEQDTFKAVSRMRTKSGQWRWILGRGKVVSKDQTGMALRMVGSHVDITEARQAEEERARMQKQLLQAQKIEAVATLASGVAHDFNNLLQAIGGHTQLMLVDRTSDTPERTRLRTIERAVERGGQLVQRLLLFGRRVEAKRRPLDLNQEALDATKILYRTILKMISTEFKPGDGLWTVNADPVQIEQILINLGVNAADAMPEGGTLTIATQNVVLDSEQLRDCPSATPGPHVMLSVTDTGCGMDQATLDKIYDPFFTTKEVGKGTGLGLASVLGIVQDHEGCILCDSSPGRGTTFRIYFPALDEAPASVGGEPEKTSAMGSGETILVVDDEADLRELTSEVLESFGYSPVVATGGQEALEFYRTRQETIGLILLDLNMPGMSGRRCLEELLRINPAVKVLIVSGYAMDSQEEKMLRAGAVGFLAKPYQMGQLLSMVRDTLGDNRKPDAPASQRDQR